MPKKRIIFTLLYDRGNFFLSRNFRLQKVGNLNWLKMNYDFSKISSFIDELIVINVSRELTNLDDFSITLKELTKGCFVPITAGGGIRSLEQARQLFNSGADKVLLNTAVFTEPQLIESIAEIYGRQSIIASIDFKTVSDIHEIYFNCGRIKFDGVLEEFFMWLDQEKVGEIYLNSIDRDGTGFGYDFSILELLPKNFRTPIIFAGGAGNYKHFEEGLSNNLIDAAATAHLFNFVGDGLKKSREKLIDLNFSLAKWQI